MKIRVLVVALTALMASGCGRNETPRQQPISDAPQSQNDAGAQSEVAAGPVVYLEQAGMRVIAPEPAPEGQMVRYHKLGIDSIIVVTPMASSGAAKILIGKGDHDVTLVQDTCKGIVKISMHPGVDAPLELSESATKSVPLPNSDAEERTVEVVMDQAAADNFGCNVMVRHRL